MLCVVFAIRLFCINVYCIFNCWLLLAISRSLYGSAYDWAGKVKIPYLFYFSSIIVLDLIFRFHLPIFQGTEFRLRQDIFEQRQRNFKYNKPESNLGKPLFQPDQQCFPPKQNEFAFVSNGPPYYLYSKNRDMVNNFCRPNHFTKEFLQTRW